VDGAAGSRVDGVAGNRLDDAAGSRVDGDTDTSSLTTYSLMGDNLDTDIKSQFIRTDGMKGNSLHYFHSLAVKDRISKLAELDITPYHIYLNTLEKTALQLLPTVFNDKAMEEVFIMIVSRILTTHMQYFQFSCSDIFTWHKDH